MLCMTILKTHDIYTDLDPQSPFILNFVWIEKNHFLQTIMNLDIDNFILLIRQQSFFFHHCLMIKTDPNRV